MPNVMHWLPHCELSSNIPSAFQLIRYACCCSNYSDFLLCHRDLVPRPSSQGYKVNRLSNTFKKFYGKHTDLVGQYKKNVSRAQHGLSPAGKPP